MKGLAYVYVYIKVTFHSIRGTQSAILAQRVISFPNPMHALCTHLHKKRKLCVGHMVYFSGIEAWWHASKTQHP